MLHHDCKRCARPPVPLAPGAECKESLDLVTGKLPEYPEFLRSSLVPSESNNLTKKITPFPPYECRDTLFYLLDIYARCAVGNQALRFNIFRFMTHEPNECTYIGDSGTHKKDAFHFDLHSSAQRDLNQAQHVAQSLQYLGILWP